MDLLAKYKEVNEFAPNWTKYKVTVLPKTVDGFVKKLW